MLLRNKAAMIVAARRVVHCRNGRVGAEMRKPCRAGNRQAPDGRRRPSSRRDVAPQNANTGIARFTWIDLNSSGSESGAMQTQSRLSAAALFHAWFPCLINTLLALQVRVMTLFQSR
ncbi:hypothetical protein [Stenotrophomonas pictorum]|uniref:hypothetical protein n=1 Tax=Stenotrophomonas pictorum TaxID=86184 RepID=UPI0011AEA851|nr:hypothetical protein [Stenotrophomonas pictorum]